MRRLFLLIYMVSVCCFAMELAVAADAERFKVTKVTIEGVRAFASDRIVGLMLTRPSGFLSKSYYYPDILNDDIDHILIFLQQNGYLDAAIIDTVVTIDSVKKTVDIRLGISEGDVTRVEGITFFGNTFIPDSVLRAFINLKKDDPLKRNVIQNGVVSILSHYAEQGYLDASVTPNVRINQEAHLAVIDITVTERYQARIDSIRLEGLKRTRPNVVTRELDFHPSDIVRYSRLLEAQRRLYLTGLFESVFVRPVESHYGDSLKKDILVEIKERSSSEFGVMVGYGSIEKLRGRIEISTINLAGTARQIGASAEANFIKQAITGSFTEPRTLGSRWQTDINLSLEFQQEPSYKTRQWGATATLGRKFGRISNASMTYRFENTTISDIKIQEIDIETRPHVRSLILAVTRDSRDNLFDPKSGMYIAWSNELAGSFLSGTNTFARSIITGKWFRPMGREGVLGTALEIGWMDHFGTSDDIPLNERFYAGGPTSLRGFGYQMVGPMDIENIPLGGKFILVYNIEMRRTFYKILGGAVFVDAGNVWSAVDKMRPDDIRIAIGAGLRFSSPLGIIRIDYGINIDAHQGEPKAKLFLGMGQAF